MTRSPASSKPSTANLDALLSETNTARTARAAGAIRGDGKAPGAVLQRLAAGLHEHMGLAERLAARSAFDAP